MQLNDPELLRTQAYVAGSWQAAADGRSFAVHDPASGRELAQVADMSAIDTQAAIMAAHASWPAWRALTGEQRAGYLQDWFDLIRQHANDLAQIITQEGGKPWHEARGEVTYAASFVRWFAAEALRVSGDVLNSPMAGQQMLVLKQAIGVAATITPWNFPAAMITRKVAPALAAGCPVIVKPAEQTPLTALALAVLAERAGLPPGVFNVLPASALNTPAVGEMLCSHPLVRKLSFTGSTETGRLLMQQSAASIKKISLELGGNAPFIVFADADLDQAVSGLLQCKFRNSGQTCISANRVLVEASIYAEFAERLQQAMSQLKVGPGMETAVDVGPLIDAAALEKLERHVADALEQGAQLRMGGHRHVLGGQFFAPTLLTDTHADMLCCQRENFGPLVPMQKFVNEAEAMELANATEYGLAAYAYTRDAARIWRLMTELEYGMLGINGSRLSSAVAPFGGVKQSGLGREGSKYGMDDYLELKYINWTL